MSGGPQAAEPRSTPAGTRHASLIADLEKWLAMETLAEVSIQDIAPRLFERLREGGLAVSRMSIGWRLLHPLYRAEDFTIDLFGDPQGRRFLYSDRDGERYRSSPLFYALTNGITVFRRRFDNEASTGDFPIFTELAACGHRDYLLTLVPFGATELHGGFEDGTYAEERGIFLSFCAERAEGFDDDDIALLTRLRYMIAVAAHSTISTEIASAVATTYLGRRAGQKVLAGSIRRGDGEIIPAVIWYCDLRGSTALSERLAPTDYVAFLNQYFEATAGAVDAAGGEILDFIGDGVLAIFPQADGGVPRAIAATEDAMRRLDGLARGRPDICGRDANLAGIAIAVGDVMFGNIGIPDRLTFSVIGTTVNSVARIEKMTKELGERVLVTDKVAAFDPRRFESRGRFALTGMAEPVELFAMVPWAGAASATSS